MCFRSRTNTFSSIVKRSWWASDLNAPMSIPSLTNLTCRISTSILSRQPNKSRSTFTFIVQRIINLVTLTNSYFLTSTSTIPSSIRANTCIRSFIPNFPIFARYLRWYTFAVVKYFSTKTETFFLVIVPYFSSLTRILNTVLSVPNSG